jgi:alpha-galactosidase
VTTEDILLAPQHLNLTEVTLVDQSDSHNELVFEREWMLTPNEAEFQITNNLIFVENPLTSAGLIFLKIAPLPHARGTALENDFKINSRLRRVQIARNYPVVMLAYEGGRTGRIAALQSFQRQLRVPDFSRDGVFLSNTWGDRNRDTRINETFIKKEIEAGACLGIDVIQIDDGWQKGRTKGTSKNGVWSGWWAADPQFWEPDPKRFPSGLGPIAVAARAHGMGLGLWFGPDSSDGGTNWLRDANRILELHRDFQINYFKIDSLITSSGAALENQRRLFDRVLQASDGEIVFDLDVTADIRPGYFSVPEMGPIFVENRYTDSHSYWPHATLRNLWKLSQYVDPLRLRIELLNNERNTNLYSNDLLAPNRYRPDTLFAMTMVANPLGWFEVSGLSEDYVSALTPLVILWKRERANLQGGTVIPIGQQPDGMAWTGFASISSKNSGGYLLLFRELNNDPEFNMDVADLFHQKLSATILAGRGAVEMNDHHVKVRIPEKLDFLWIRLDSTNSVKNGS